MKFSTDGHLWIPAVLVILLGYLYCFVTAEEPCYRGDAHLDYDNPCSDESGQPSKLSFCFRGMRLADRCTENCVYCDEGTYQDKFTNCSTCLPCTTAEDCPSGQVLTSVCTAEKNAVCGCPAPPPCPTCESCPTVPPCPTVTPCPVQTECPACECPACEWPTNAPVTTGPQEAIKLMFIRECPANILAGPLSGSETKTVHWREPQATDAATIVQSHHPGDRFFAGNTTVVYVFKTEEHSIDCSFVVTVSEETFIPTTPSRRDEASEASTPESGKSDFQAGSDISWHLWILVVLMGVLNLILIVCLVRSCHKKNPQKAHADGQLHQPPEANLDVPQRVYPAHQPVAARALNEYQRGERGGIELDPLGQNMPSPGNNNIPTKDGGGAEGGSATASDASSRGLELDPQQQNTPPPGNTLHGAAGGDGRNAATTSYTGSNRGPVSGEAVYGGARGGFGEDDSANLLLLQSHSPSTSVGPAQNPGPSGMQSDQRNNGTAPLRSHSYSPSSSVEPAQHPGLYRMQSDQQDYSATPLLSQLYSPPSSVAPVQIADPGPSRVQSVVHSHPEELITSKDRRDSEVTEMELRWLAKIVYEDGRYLNRHTSLYGYLNIRAGAIPRIRHEHLSNNPDNHLETEIFTIIHYGRLERNNRTMEEDSRGHLIKQLYTFDRNLAEAYAKYINRCEDFSIMWPVQSSDL